jgi:hypothetical protein
MVFLIESKAVSLKILLPVPIPFAIFPVIVTFKSVASPRLYSPPPLSVTILALSVLFVRLKLPLKLSIPPPVRA